jgi:hypothetical protein
MLFEKQVGEKLASSVSWYPIHLLQAGGLKHWQQKVELPSVPTGMNSCGEGGGNSDNHKN